MGRLSHHILQSHYVRIALLLGCCPLLYSCILLTSMTDAAAQASTPSKLTQLQLQAELMSFADRLMTFLAQAARDPHIRQDPLLFIDQHYIMTSAETIAASPNPAVGLLDMVVLTTLGRMIYEEHYSKQYGDLVQPVIKALRELEVDVWRVAGRVLTPAEQRDLRDLIHAWRRSHPTQTAFAYIRFSDFAEERQTFTLAEAKKAHGLFQSIQEATQKVDEIRLVAERGIFLATRMPLLFGAFLEVWVSRALQRPEMVQLRDNVTQVSNAVDRAVQQVEQMPDNVNQLRSAAIKQLMDRVSVERQTTIKQFMDRMSVERQATIKQFMDRVSVERQAAINQLMDRVSTERQVLMQDLAGDEAGRRGVLSELEQTLTAGSSLATTVKGAIEALDTYTARGAERLTAAGKQPADVADVRALMENVAQAAHQLQSLTESLNAFLLSPGWEQRLPLLLQVLDQTAKKGEDLITYASARMLFFGLVLLTAFLVSLLIAGFILIPYIAKRFPGLSSKPS